MGLFEGPSIALSEGAGDEGSKLVWNQIAKVGAFKGHAAGPFELTPQTFSEIVKNFEATTNQHIPVDFEHASELHAAEGSIPTHGAPATGWVKKLENRGEAGLWGLFEWHEPARTYIKEGRYKFLSPAIRFRSRDRVSGQAVGARLTSVGLTNGPFLDGLRPLAARHDEGPDDNNDDEEEDESAPLVACDDPSDDAKGVTEMDPIKMKELETKNDELSLKLSAAEARAAKSETDLKTLLDWKAKREHEDLAALVDLAFDTYKDSMGLEEVKKPSMMRLARADREAFDDLYPRLKPNERHLLSNLTAARTSSGAPPRRLETVFEMADRLQKDDPTLSREEALLSADAARIARMKSA